jgi:hypothetical protein
MRTRTTVVSIQAYIMNSLELWNFFDAFWARKLEPTSEKLT